MTIDPRVGLYVSIVAAILSALIAGGATFTDMFGPDNAKIILGILGLANAVINAVNAILHAIPSQAGPQAAKEFPLGPKA